MTSISAVKDLNAPLITTTVEHYFYNWVHIRTTLVLQCINYAV